MVLLRKRREDKSKSKVLGVLGSPGKEGGITCRPASELEHSRQSLASTITVLYAVPAKPPGAYTRNTPSACILLPYSEI
jgi:hypothetical protein